jgi:hypothetical protein
MRPFLVLALGLTASAGFAQPPASAPPADANANEYNPSEILCRRMIIPGSRLQSGRMCKTRAEWALQRMTDRMDTERIQTRRIIAR